MSEVVRPEPDPGVLSWLNSQTTCFLSSLTVGELQKGITTLPEGAKKRGLQVWFADKIVGEFRNRILAVDMEVALAWGQLQGELQCRGVRLPVSDGLLAATALPHRLTLVTGNTKDFASTEVKLVDPWA